MAEHSGGVTSHGQTLYDVYLTGEAMEQGLRDCCRSIRIGKILVQSDEDTHEAKVLYAKLPPDIADRKVLLMYPIMSMYITVLQFTVINLCSNIIHCTCILEVGHLGEYARFTCISYEKSDFLIPCPKLIRISEISIWCVLHCPSILTLISSHNF